jgi:hypothetical protein
MVGNTLWPKPCSENLMPPAKKHIPRTSTTDSQLRAQMWRRTIKVYPHKLLRIDPTTGKIMVRLGYKMPVNADVTKKPWNTYGMIARYVSRISPKQLSAEHRQAQIHRMSISPYRYNKFHAVRRNEHQVVHIRKDLKTHVFPYMTKNGITISGSNINARKHTRVALRSPAKVWPTRRDSSSVANARS